MITFTRAEWKEKYKPIVNPDTGEIEFNNDCKANYPNNRIWTNICEGEDDYLINGFYFVNAIEYFVTEVAWEGGTIIVPIPHVSWDTLIENLPRD